MVKVVSLKYLTVIRQKETDSKQKTTLMSAKLLYPLRQRFVPSIENIDKILSHMK